MKIRISQETIVDPFENLLDASLFQIMGLMIFFLFWSFPHICGHEVVPFLIMYSGIEREKVQCIFNDTSIDRNFFQDMPACAIDDAFAPV